MAWTNLLSGITSDQIQIAGSYVPDSAIDVPQLGQLRMWMNSAGQYADVSWVLPSGLVISDVVHVHDVAAVLLTHGGSPADITLAGTGRLVVAHISGILNASFDGAEANLPRWHAMRLNRAP